MSSLSSSYSSSVSCTSITNLRHRRNPSGIILPLRSVLLNTNLRVEILRLEIWIQHIQKNGHLYFLWSSLLGIRSAEHLFTFSSHTECVNRESIVIAKMKRSLSIWWTQKKKNVRLSVCLWIGPVHRYNNFSVIGSMKSIGGCLLCIKWSFVIEIQSKILFLILILKKNLTKLKNWLKLIN